MFWQTTKQALKRFSPWFDLKGYSLRTLQSDSLAGITVAFLSVPQGVAYALIAGLPPAMGLYAAAVPPIIGGLFRSSRYVVTGPTNAVSLLVGGIVASQVSLDPVPLAITLAFTVGLIQVLAGWLRLGAIVDYISAPVILGYITGAGVLIAAGQLKNLTGTSAERGSLVVQVFSWVQGIENTSLMTLGFGVGTFLLVLLLRKIDRRIPGAVVAMGLGVSLSALFSLRMYGVETIADIAETPQGFPPFYLPDISMISTLISAAVACTLLSLVEASSVARALASRSGQQLDMSVEFAGHGLANLVGSFFGSFPTSGSPTRSTLLLSAGAKSRLAGVFSGVVILIVLWFLGPVVDFTPIASLAGLLLVVATDLVDIRKIRKTLHATPSDIIAFLATLVGTWVLPLDLAVVLGVGISIVLFLRRARLLVIRELIFGVSGRLRESKLGSTKSQKTACRMVRVLHLEGALFFGAAGELQNALDTVTRDPFTRVVVLRLKRTQGLDLSIASLLEDTALRLRAQEKYLILAGMRPLAQELLERTGVAEMVGPQNLFPTETRWFYAMEQAMSRALELSGVHNHADCPLVQYVNSFRSRDKEKSQKHFS